MKRQVTAEGAASACKSRVFAHMDSPTSVDNGASKLVGKILTLHADQLVRREGNVEIELSILD